MANDVGECPFCGGRLAITGCQIQIGQGAGSGLAFVACGGDDRIFSGCGFRGPDHEFSDGAGVEAARARAREQWGEMEGPPGGGK